MIFLTLMKPDKMETAIIESVTEKNDPQYGPEKISKLILQPSGESRTAYTKPAAQTVYNNLRAGLLVELKPKSGGKGYWIQSIIGEATDPAPAQPGNGQAPANRADATVYRKPAGPSREEIGEYIKTKSGQYFYAYSCLKELFDNEQNGILVTEDTIRQAAATVIISLDRHFG